MKDSKMKYCNKCSLLLAALCLFLVHQLYSLSTAIAESTKYSVFCASNKIEVDMRTLEQMRQARGSDVCMFGQFDYLGEAEDFAKKQFKGEGASCTCH